MLQRQREDEDVWSNPTDSGDLLCNCHHQSIRRSDTVVCCMSCKHCMSCTICRTDWVAILILLSFFIARSNYASAVLQIVILSVRLSVRPLHALWQSKEHAAEILISHERVITLVFRYLQKLVISFYLKIVLKVTHPALKKPTSTNISL